MKTDYVSEAKCLFAIFVDTLHYWSELWNHVLKVQYNSSDVLKMIKMIKRHLAMVAFFADIML